MTTPFDDALAAHDRAREEHRIAKLRAAATQDRLSTALKALRAVCPHTERTRESRYSEGSYYDRASTHCWFRCVACGTDLDHTVEQHSWYG